MATIVTRAGKASPLTNQELDSNFNNLNTDKAELSGAAFTGAITTNSTIDGRDVAADGVTADAALPKAGGAMTGAITTNSTFDGVDIATRDAVLTSTTTTANAALPKAGGTLTGTLQGTRVGIGVAAHSSAALNITTTDQHIRFNNGSELGIIDLDSDGELNIWAHGDGEVINLRTGSGAGSDIVKISPTGIDVTGTATMDGLTVESASGSNGAKFSTNDATAANNAGILVYNYASATATSRHSDLIFDPSGANAAGGDYLVISAKGDNSASIINYHATSTLALGTAGNERLKIDSSGNVGIGVSPSNKLDIKGTVGFEATNSTNKWLAYTYTDNTFRLNYNGAGADELVVDSSGITTFTKSGGGNIRIAETASRYVEIMGYAEGSANGSTMAFHTIQAGTSTSTERARIDSSGYVGINQSSPSSYYAKNLVVGAATEGGITIASNATTAWAYLMFADGTSGDNAYSGYLGHNHANDNLVLSTKGTLSFGSGGGTRLNIDSSGNVAIGNNSASSFTSASAQNLVVGSGSGHAGMTVYSGTTSVGGLAFADGTAAGSHYRGLLQYRHSEDAMLLYTGEAERARIDSSGNVIVSGTAAGQATSVALHNTGYVHAVSSHQMAGIFDRRDSDGDILIFRKDGSGTAVGSIGTTGGNLQFMSGSVGVGVGGDNLYPTNGSGNSTDGALDLGDATARFKDLYLSGGVYLGGTGAANKLDDYEEGTWTPVLASDATPAGYTTQVGKYTKIGNLVNVVFNVQMSNLGNFAGAVVAVTGLPFIAANNACEEIGTVNVKDPASALPAVSYLRVLNNSTSARLELASGTTTSDHNCPANKIDTGTLLQGSITYLTA